MRPSINNYDTYWALNVRQRFEEAIERLFVPADPPKPAKRHVIADRRNVVWEQQSNGKYVSVANKSRYLSKANEVELDYIIANFGPVTDLEIPDEPAKEPKPVLEPFQVEVGDVVGLKSGGPSMTVINIVEALALCQWFFGKELKSNSFPIPALRKETT